MKIETRVFTNDVIESRSEDDKTVVRGHAAVFNKRSENLGGFQEIIEPGAFDDVMGDDVRALFNHDANLILGRSKSGTLDLSVDETGLAYEIDMPDTQAARDLLVSMGRGDVDQSSFAFTVKDDEWEEKDGQYIRTIKKADRLFDVSPVTYPAYPDADAGLRSLEEFKKSLETAKDDHTEKNISDLALRKAQVRVKELA
ncbi:MAG: HK97 family phage prohead protease [Gammaproteobacteria bacterium]|nr:HK97 family phage prohead protease [Gammaproteobacteria bacterium]